MFEMDTVTLANLWDLFGFWSCFAFALGLGAALASHRLGKRSTASNQTEIIGALPWLMWLAAFLISLPMAVGPKPFDGLENWSRDKSFAPLVALAFGLVFAFDSLRFQKLRLRATTWACLLFYFATTIGFIESGRGK